MSDKHTFLKVFGITAVFLTVFIGLIIFFLIRYFGAYYTATKENEFKSVVQSAGANFDNSSTLENEMISYLRDLYDEYNCVAFLYSADDISNRDFLKKNMSVLEEPNDVTGVLEKEVLNYLFGGSNSKYSLKTVVSNNLTYLISVQTVNINNSPYVLGIYTSLQAVDDAMASLNSISWLAYLVSAAVSFLIAIIIAKSVTQPLIREIERRKALDIMRRDFIANVSHEMKTPISIISGYAESLMDGILSLEERSEYEHAIFDESQKMGKLVRDMLEVALLQNEKSLPKKEKIRLNELIKNIVSRLEKQAKAKKIDIDLENLPAIDVTADENMIETVIINLLVNAISHTPEHRKISISLKDYVSKIRFEIENEGLPVPDDAIPHIWESFYRVDKAHSREDGRFGLGLSTVKTIIEKHSGTVGFDNKNGSVMFYFEIPKNVING